MTDFNQETFETNLKNIYSLVSARFEHIVITGSAALVYFCIKNNILTDIIPADIDIITVQSDDITEDKIFSFESRQGITSSKTFSDGDQCFDLIKSPRVKYITLDGIKIIHPSQLLKNYEDEFDQRDKDIPKIELLKENASFYESIPFDVYDIKKKKRDTEDILISANSRKRLFE